jgi:hypothetical protein
MKSNLILRAGIVAGLGMASAGAWATECDSALSNYQSYVSTNDLSGAGYIVSNHPECFGGSGATSQAQINATAFTQVTAISNAMAQRLTSGGPVATASLGLKGMAAGGAAGKWNFWGNLNNSDTRQSYTAANGFKTKNESDVMTVVLGGDYALSNTLNLGVSGAFDEGDGSGINRAPGNTPNGSQTNGYLIAPYLGWQFAKAWSVDASAGFGRGQLETNTNTDVSASRWFAAANLNYSRWMGNWQFTGRASLLHGVEDYNDIKNSTTGAKFVGTDARNTLDQLRLGVQAGYWMNGVMPYVSLAYTNDIRRKTTQFGVSGNPIGRDAWVWGLGMNFYSLKDGVTGGVGFSHETGRNNQTNYGMMANINIRF